jgi:5-methylcytosine-specific restriction endonuclease McrA
MSYQNKKDAVWNKGKTIRGKKHDLYRKDKLGNTIYYSSYGKNSEMGWEIDHSKPQSKGGTDHLNNLQPLNTKANRQKGNK